MATPKQRSYLCKLARRRPKIPPIRQASSQGRPSRAQSAGHTKAHAGSSLWLGMHSRNIFGHGILRALALQLVPCLPLRLALHPTSQQLYQADIPSEPRHPVETDATSSPNCDVSASEQAVANSSRYWLSGRRTGQATGEGLTLISSIPGFSAVQHRCHK